MKKLSIHSAERLMAIFWPDFSVIKGCVFLKSLKFGPRVDVSYPTDTESAQNHTHILDLFRHDAFGTRQAFKPTHPDFKVAYRIGRTLCVMWAYKLMSDFPHDNFRVYLTGHDPIVRFHKIRKGVPNWLTLGDCNPEDIRTGKIMILDTTTMRKHNKSLHRMGAPRRRPAMQEPLRGRHR